MKRRRKRAGAKLELSGVASADWAGLNTDIPVFGAKLRYVRVLALDAEGHVLATSNVTALPS